MGGGAVGGVGGGVGEGVLPVRHNANNEGTGDRVQDTGYSPRHNANNEGTVELYAEAIRRSDTICLLCHIYARDYECLG